MLNLKFELLNHSLLANPLKLIVAVVVVVVVVLIGCRSLISLTDLHKFLSLSSVKKRV